ncbi:facilitated trehalose transporter Tret1-like [Penaeus vannamei]|uniref:facilitated trehalose transporter Tret1-like n=1 Tax=Penaeus vannamei TaxID=6689 RepID=UPI00387F3845
MAVIGRRYSMILSGVVCFASWVGVALLPTPTSLLVARAVAGIASGSMSVAGNTYAVEMADVEIRGAMALIPTVTLMLGQVLTVVVGYVARYYVVALVCSAIPLAYVVAMVLLPESPAFLAVKGHEKRARKTLLRLRGEHADVDAEIEGFRTMNAGAEGGSIWRGLLQADVARALGAVCGLFLVQAFTGYFVFTVNTSRFFKGGGLLRRREPGGGHRLRRPVCGDHPGLSPHGQNRLKEKPVYLLPGRDGAVRRDHGRRGEEEEASSLLSSYPLTVVSALEDVGAEVSALMIWLKCCSFRFDRPAGCPADPQWSSVAELLKYQWSLDVSSLDRQGLASVQCHQPN